MAVTINDVKKCIELLSENIVKNEVYFCELDSFAGDGDFGMSLSKGFREVLFHLEEFETKDMGVFINDCAMIIYEYCGGASGPIWGSGFKAAARSVKGKIEIDDIDVAGLFENAIAGIQKKGGAVLGDKTLLDSLIPAAAALKASLTGGSSLRTAFEAASIAAAEGAENTKLIIAKKGRATYLGERSISYPDAGAMAISVILNELLQQTAK